MMGMAYLGPSRSGEPDGSGTVNRCAKWQGRRVGPGQLADLVAHRRPQIAAVPGLSVSGETGLQARSW